MVHYNLPSWTGVAGVHTKNHVNTTSHPRLECNIGDNMWMHIKTKWYSKISITPYECCLYSLSKIGVKNIRSILQQMDEITVTRYKVGCTDMVTVDKDTVLKEWLANMNVSTNLYVTHYHQRHDNSLTQIRTLTLTEDCEECIILPILFKVSLSVPIYADEKGFNTVIHHYSHSYYLAVICECTEGKERYKAVGTYYVGHDKVTESPTFNYHYCLRRDENITDDAEEIINILFENNFHDIPREFIIQ